MVKVRDDYPQLADGSVDIESWVERIVARYPGLRHDTLNLACQITDQAEREAKAAQNIWPNSASVFLTGLEMAEILSDLRLDQETLVAAVVYRAVREGKLALEIVNKQLGASVADLVDGVLRMAAISRSRSDAEEGVLGQTQGQADKTRKMLVSLVNDVRVALIKLSERTCAIRAVKDFPGKREQVAAEVANIYAPLAHRLGIGHIKWELEDLSFRYLEPDAYKRIAHLLDERRVDRDSFIDLVVAALREQLAAAEIDGEVYGRAKHIYSIWKKMQRKNVGFSQLYDIRAVRILVNDVRECYAVLGIVHTLWRNIPNEFDDYVANPKHNGYRSLHTAVIGPHGKVLEVQIRTRGMHDEAEFGVCAHWQYKGADSTPAGNDSYEEKIAWLRQVLEWHEEAGGADVDAEALQREFVQDRIYVFTPDGHVVDLVANATPIDFAYHIHTEVGHRCRGAKVNGRIVPLTYQLQTGDQIEIMTAKEGGPSRDWLRESLGYVNSSRTRSKIQQWFKQVNRDENIAAGRTLLEREFRRLALTSVDYKTIAHGLNCNKVEDMYAGVGAGTISTQQVFRIAQTLLEVQPTEELATAPAHDVRDLGEGIQVVGVGKLLSQLARCCKPVPGDDIVGYITQGRGVSIHRSDCPQFMHLAELDERRTIEVSWGASENKYYPVDIRIEAYDRQGLLRDITTLLSNAKVNVIGVQTSTDRSTHIASMRLTIEVSSMDELARLLMKISQLRNVMTVEREAR